MVILILDAYMQLSSALRLVLGWGS